MQKFRQQFDHVTLSTIVKKSFDNMDFNDKFSLIINR